VLLDYVDFVVHVFHPELREFYQLERLWGDAPVVVAGTQAVQARKDKAAMRRTIPRLAVFAVLLLTAQPVGCAELVTPPNPRSRVDDVGLLEVDEPATLYTDDRVRW